MRAATIFKSLMISLMCCWLLACGFHPQGQVKLAPPLHKIYLYATDPYSEFIRTLKLYLKMSHVQLVDSPADADTTLSILQDTTSQSLLSVNGTQQTRQYLLQVIISFQISNRLGQLIVPPQPLADSRVITVQSNQILGTSNEVNLYYKQMRRELAYALMNRIASDDITKLINQAAAH